MTAPLYLPPFADFVAWLRAAPDRVFPAKPDDDRGVGCYCPVGVYARTFNEGDRVAVSHDRILRVCGDSDQGYEYIDSKYYSAITLFDTVTGFMSKSITARELLDDLGHSGLLKEIT